MEPYANQPQDLSTPELPAPHRHFFNKKFITTFVVLLALGGTALAGQWWWQQMEGARTDEDLAEIPVVVHQTSDWKTYTNTQYGFEFKYPKDWIFSSDVINMTVPVSRFFVNSPQTAQQMKLEQQSGKDVDLREISEDVRLIIDQHTPNDTYSTIISDSNKYKNLYKKVMISGETGYQTIISDTGHNSYSSNVANILVEHRGLIYSFDFYNLPSKDDLSDIDKQILSTFKFIDAGGQFCGGIAAGQFQCPAGYTCKLAGNYPDAGGTCAKN